MNKKIIKYLIWTILITALLILIPMTHIIAEDTGAEEVTVTFNDFKTSENLFCLNHGLPFGTQEIFTPEQFSTTRFKEITGMDVDEDVLKYIVSESNIGSYDDRTAVGNYIPQIAIWKLAGSTNFGFLSEYLIADADKLIADAYAYKDFPSNKVPTIEKNGTNEIAIKYYKTISTTDFGNGTYTNLLFDTISVTGASIATNEDGTEKEDENLGNGYYKRIYIKNPGATQVTVSFEYEADRTAYLEIYNAKEERKKSIIYYNNNSLEEQSFLKIGETYYHNGCGGYQEPCTKVTIDNIVENGFLLYDYEFIDISRLNDLEADGCIFYRCESRNHPIIAVNNTSAYDVRYRLSNRKNDFGQTETYIEFYDYALRGTKASETYYPQNLLYGTGSISARNKNETIEIISPVNITINKTDSLQKDSQGNPLKLSNVRFKLELTNIKTLTGHSPINTEKEIVYATTDNKGQIKLTGILPNDISEEITVTITETAEPTANGYYYKKLDNPITITLTYNSSTGTWSKGEDDPGTLSGSTLTVNIKNTPYITLSGMVWEDKQKNEKQQPEPPNGLNDDGANSGLGGVYVALYSEQTGKRIGDGCYTDENGAYSFKDIPKTNEGYRVIFNYDGINWQETSSLGNAGKDSKIEVANRENGKDNYEYYIEAATTTRDDFNNRFKTISAGIATGTYNGATTTTPLSYTYDQYEKVSTLEVGMDGTNPANGNATDFQMRARTDIYRTSQNDLNCGLVKKNFDLALTTNIENAEITINGASTAYTDFSEPIIIDNQPSSESGSDNLYLYRSDYNYRKSDYVTDNIVNIVNPDNIEGEEIAGEELNVYVTYKVSLINQTGSQNANVDKFVYYYDNRYTLLESESYLNGYQINSNTNNMIEFEKIDKNSYIPEDGRIELTLKFEVDIDDINTNVSDFGNAGEIIQYSTENGGLIDKDSAPENSNITRTTEGKAIISTDEDDSDQARGLNIQIKEDKVRKISGTVFEDTDKDGNNNENSSVEGVIVQLIEIKKIGTQYYEYIWQEKTTDNNGYYEFTNFIPSGGIPNRDGVINYNYIIRFIYGDGSTYDLTPDIANYNGQDYKSTKDANYNSAWYNTSNYSTGASVARDNEARRLEVMAHSTIVDGKVGTALDIFTDNNKTFNNLTNQEKQNIVGYYNLVVKTQYNNVKDVAEETNPNEYLVAQRIKNIFGDTLPDITIENINEDLYSKIKRYVSLRTWMCAETSRINVQVDAEDITDIDTTEVTSSNQSLEFTDVNFGLALRPQNKLTLEKHITGLKITPSGTGVQDIINASKDIEAYYDEDTENDMPTGITQGLATIMSTRGERGWWQVETDVEELMQGADLEVEYTYVLKNDGEIDYLSNTLVEAYENQDTVMKPYNEALAEIKDTVKATMRSGTYSYSNNNTIGTYLGQVYYRGLNEDGSIPETDAIVPSRVEIFEEALNNDLAFDAENEEYFSKANSETVQKTVYNVAGEAKTQEINTVVQNTLASTFLTPGSKDLSKTITLRTTLATVGGGELGANLPSYIAEIMQYSNAAGRKDMDAAPANLSYVHSDDDQMTLDTYRDGNVYYQVINGVVYKLDITTATEYEETNLEEIPETAVKINENDEFWGETITIRNPQGEDKLTPVQIVLITISAVAVLGVGIVLIKKIVLKK